MKYKRSFTALAMLAPFAAGAAAPGMNDYARGAVIESDAEGPLLEMTLPDEVYRSGVRADLRDLRVFNAGNTPVPHAFCAAPESGQPQVIERSLPVFELRKAPRRAGSGVRIEVQTAEGSHVNVQEGRAGRSPARTHIIDAREIENALRGMEFEWESPDGASEAKVRIEASEDLDRWQVVVPASTLLRVTEGRLTLARERIELPVRRYKYLRVTRADGGPPLRIHAVVAESIAPAAEIEPVWFSPDPLTASETAATEAAVLPYDAGRAAPVRFARVRLPQTNSSMNVTLQSRADPESPWRERWSGETYLILAETERRESPPARFAATTDRYWRVLLPKDAAPASRPALELGYRPVRLRFLAQGPEPYTLAFGSRRAELASPAACEALLGDVSSQERRQMIGPAYVRDSRILGGEAAFKPLPERTPTRMIVLWSVLVVGVGLLIAMALSLLKRIRPNH